MLEENKNPLTNPRLAGLPSPNKAQSFKVKKSTSVGSLPNIEAPTSLSTGKKSLMLLSKVDMTPQQSDDGNKKNVKNITMRSTNKKWASLQLQNSLKRYKQIKKQANDTSKTLVLMKKFQQSKQTPSLAIPQQNYDLDYNSVGTSKIKTKLTLQKSASKLEQLSNPKRYQKIQRNQSTTLSQLLGNSVRFSDKKAGQVRGYAVSSQIGTLCTVNTVRISIALNILKTANKSKETSFFGIFQGKHGMGRADFMRQNFHQGLVSDQYFFYNFEKAVSRTFQKADRQFTYDPRFQGDYSSVQMVACVVVGTTMYFIRYGNPNATVSSGLGTYIKSFTAPVKKKQASKGLLGSTTYEINIRSFQLNDDFDFLLLGSEGMYQLFNSTGELGKYFWRQTLEEEGTSAMNTMNSAPKSDLGSSQSKFYKTEQNVTNSQASKLSSSPQKNQLSAKLARACHRMCWRGIKSDKMGRCMSMVVVAFGNSEKCFSPNIEEEQILDLPFVGKNINDREKQLFQADNQTQKFRKILKVGKKVNLSLPQQRRLSTMIQNDEEESGQQQLPVIKAASKKLSENQLSLQNSGRSEKK